MSPNMKHPPIAWRQGEGYIHPEELPPPPPTPTPMMMMPVGFFPPPVGFWGPPPPPGWSGFAAPPLSPYSFGPPGYWAPPPFPQGQAPPLPPKKAGDDKKKSPAETPDEYKLPGGHLPGSVFHYQEGKHVVFHVLGTPTTDIDKVIAGSHDGFISKHIHKFNENTSIEAVMKKLKAGEGGKMTQVFEKGGGAFTRGTTWEVGSEKAKKGLKEYGWGGAGVEVDVEPIWVVVQKKKEEGKK
ncbi:hypothetical protein FKW77_006665 [Venturia effusa]|uniref:Uncharacterized protein n=1 Tax=Venturia effusa TaxID=50376 RepID=A0A517L7I9_9PEZI|nr:hypothetical protein FKW77_006665 [Venturia effusa]